MEQRILSKFEVLLLSERLSICIGLNMDFGEITQKTETLRSRERERERESVPFLVIRGFCWDIKAGQGAGKIIRVLTLLSFC